MSWTQSNSRNTVRGLGLKNNLSTNTVRQRRFLEGQPCCAGTRPELLITRLKLVRTLAAPQPPNTLSKSDSSQNEMFFQEREMKTLSPPLFLSPSLLPLPNTDELGPSLPLSITLILSHTICFTPCSSLPFSHISLLSSPLAPRCVSL